MNVDRGSPKLIDPLKLNRLFTAIAKLTDGDKEKEAAYRTIITGLVHDIAGLDLLHTASKEVLKGSAWAHNRLIAILNLLMALEPSTPGEPQPSSARPASRPKGRKSNPDGSPSNLGLPPSTGYPPCFLFPQDIFPVYFATLFVIPEEAAGPVIQYLDRQLAKIAPLDLLYDLAEGILTGEGVALEMFRSALEIVEMGREALGAAQRGDISGLSGFLGPSGSSSGGNPPAMKPMSGEIPPRLFAMPYCVGIREDCTDEAVRAAREAQAMRAERGACVIESVQPSRASIGDEIVITGSNLGDMSGEVIFPGNIRGTVGEWTDTRIKVTVTPGTRSGSICLRIPLGYVMACGVSINVYAEGCCIDFCVLRQILVPLQFLGSHGFYESSAEALVGCDVISVQNKSEYMIELSYRTAPEANPIRVELGPGDKTNAFNGSPMTENGLWWAYIRDGDRPGVIEIELTCDECA